MNVNGVQAMISNKEIVRYIFGESKIIKKSNFTNFFLKQILNADTENFELDIDEDSDLYVWENGIWIDGNWKNGYWENGTWENGNWENGNWENGTWKNGIWKYGLWEKGTWAKGKIWDLEKNKYIESTLPPNQCKWSLSYGK